MRSHTMRTTSTEPTMIIHAAAVTCEGRALDEADGWLTGSIAPRTGPCPGIIGGRRGWGHELPRSGEQVRRHRLPPVRTQRAEAAPAVARAVAELRGRPPRGEPAGDPATGLRPRGDPLRPGQQL